MYALFTAVQATVLTTTKVLAVGNPSLADYGSEVEKRLKFVLGGTWVVLAIMLVIVNTIKAYYNERGYQIIWYYTLASSITIAVVVTLYYFILVLRRFRYI